ncbi:hypothetical protein C5167_048892 [Papaver somniferum]|uniref:Uncharacterized protein n=1 Tax=Papaver somniferum TaxID=3469 RepID=A0A4Y7KLZ2_PAPSO|nr:hypothetical protein C5167_048892 [Papaver somniferum]
MVLAGGGKSSETLNKKKLENCWELRYGLKEKELQTYKQRKGSNDNHLWGTIEVMMCDLGLSSELKLACNSALMKVVGPISLILDWLKYRESTTNRHIPYRLSLSVLQDKLATGKVTSCIIFCRVSLNESSHDRSTCSVFSIFFCPQFLEELLDTLAGSSLLGRMITSKACLHGRHCDLRIHLLEFPRYVEAYFFTKEDEVVAGSALADMILKETNLY